MSKNKYKESGVNIELGDEVSRIFYNAAKQTWKNRCGVFGEVLVPYDDFSGLRVIDVSNLPTNTVMNIGFDGVGTKIELAERVGTFNTIAFDLFAMVCDDAVIKGGEPVLIGSILDVNSLCNADGSFIKQINEIAQGYINAAKEANVVILNGEIAELGNRVNGFGNFNCNWGATVVWFAKKKRMFTGHQIIKGDYLIGLKEAGFRSNGLSLVRKTMHDVHGEDWHNKHLNGITIGELVLTPSKIYCKAIVSMFGGYNRQPLANIHGVAHITGGGLFGKLQRILKPSGLGAKIDDPFDPAPMMLYCQEKGGIDDDEAYRTWNMGQGMVIITPEPEQVIQIANKHQIEAKIIGSVASDSSISVKNKGYYSKGEFLKYSLY